MGDESGVGHGSGPTQKKQQRECRDGDKRAPEDHRLARGNAHQGEASCSIAMPEVFGHRPGCRSIEPRLHLTCEREIDPEHPRRPPDRGIAQACQGLRGLSVNSLERHRRSQSSE
ncbi:protein of unknown function (plasmid) [Cupriavidus taiwanensis]|uniref:Uncharacterized protein n=1 Tax=Cupriavidus taiwanensis TaxID=164546 RepID=A0A375IRT9_9BURK|nr:protein of unknown function [Cupriavidus taiwanensis]